MVILCSMRFRIVFLATVLVVGSAKAAARFDVNVVKSSKALYELPRKSLYATGLSDDGRLITILNGNIHVASADKTGAGDTIRIENSFKTKTSSLIYSNVARWNEIPIPANVKTMADLPAFIDSSLRKLGYENPGMAPFLLKGNFATVRFHLDHEGTSTKYSDQQSSGIVLGYFSKSGSDLKVFMHFVKDSVGPKAPPRSGYIDEIDFSLTKANMKTKKNAKHVASPSLFLPRQ